MTVPQALEIKEELETIDRLLSQLEEAAKTAQVGIIDMEELSEYAEPGEGTGEQGTEPWSLGEAK